MVGEGVRVGAGDILFSGLAENGNIWRASEFGGEDDEFSFRHGD